MSEVTEESFLKDVQNHQITIMLDSGLYRHVRFKQPGTNNCYFDLITGPGYLLYRGDMGCYEFERLKDMFEFFRTDLEYAKKKGKQLSINTGYWAEKCQADSKFGNGIEGFSSKIFEEKVRELAKEFVDDESSAFYDDKNYDSNEERAEAFNEQIDELISSVSNGQEAHNALRDWEFNQFDFEARNVFGQDSWEYDFNEYTHHFIWCCYAITWGIEQYDKVKQTEVAL